MKVIAKGKGFYGGKLKAEGDSFTIESRLDASAKQGDQVKDIELQFSDKWMAKADSPSKK